MQILFRLFYCGLALLVGILAVESHRLSDQTENLAAAPLHGTQSQPVQQRLQEIQSALEFMVWPTERQKLLTEQVQLWQTEVQNNPLLGDAWFGLLSAQVQNNSDDSQLSWSLMHALELREWDNRTHWNFVYYCVVLDARVPAAVRARCDQLLRATNLVKKQRYVAANLGLSEKLVNDRFNAAGAIQ